MACPKRRQWNINQFATLFISHKSNYSIFENDINKIVNNLRFEMFLSEFAKPFQGRDVISKHLLQLLKIDADIDAVCMNFILYFTSHNFIFSQFTHVDVEG